MRFLLRSTASMATIAVLGTMDTKGDEHGFVAKIIRRRGHQTLVIDVGTLTAPRIIPDVTRQEVAAAAQVDLGAMILRQDRGECVAAMSLGAPKIVARLAAEGRINGIISLGGGGGTAIATAAMRELPVGFPKVMVSTLASGNTAPYLGVKDIVMMPSVVDIAGLNRFSRQILTRAAGAICGMVEVQPESSHDKPLIVASQFGNTTACVDHARKRLEVEGFEVLVFAAVGTGGRTMESLIESGMVAGVLDITTTEWADELVGGVLSAGPSRLDAAARCGIPAIIAPGCLDMVNFGACESVPPRFAGRKFYQHNPQVTLMRTTPEECRELGRIIAGKLNRSTGPVSVLLPLQGISVISQLGQPFHDPVADASLFTSLKSHLDRRIPVIEVDSAINAPLFAEVCADTLLRQIGIRAKQ